MPSPLETDKAGETSPLFGALLCCFVFAVVFVSLGWGFP